MLPLPLPAAADAALIHMLPPQVTDGRASDYDDNAPPPPTSLTGLELNAGHPCRRAAQHQPQQGFPSLVRSFRNEAIAWRGPGEMTPFDSVSASAVRRACRECNPRTRASSFSAVRHQTCEIVDGELQDLWRNDALGKTRWAIASDSGAFKLLLPGRNPVRNVHPVSVFDGVLNRKRNKKKDIPEYEEIQKCLKLNIVNCLREHQFVRADHTRKSSSTCCCDHALKHDPYIKLSSNQACHVLQLFVDSSHLPDTETLLHLTLLQAGLKLTQTRPFLFVLQTPRSGKDYKLFDRVVPSTELDISNLLTEHPRQCCVLRKACLNWSATTAFCSSRRPAKITLSAMPGEDEAVRSLSAFHTSHYVCFCALCSHDNGQPIVLFFDSMARPERGLERAATTYRSDRRVGDIDSWLNGSKLKDSSVQPPPEVKRLLSIATCASTRTRKLHVPLILAQIFVLKNRYWIQSINLSAVR
uniref:Tub domain-containing protein n=1 Tax=Macrostomum lignano TaxID=282301 RepID=A0A1I8FH20_9PLAT